MKGHVQSLRRAWTGGLEPGLVAAYTSVGVGIGVGVDALITHHKVIYERPVARAGKDLGFTHVGQQTQGVLVTMSF